MAAAAISYYNRPKCTQPAISGRQVRIGILQSISSSNMPSCAAVIRTTPSTGDGQINRAFSRRLANRHIPCVSQYSALIKSPRRPLKQNVTRERVLLQHRLNLHRKPVHALAHVGPAASQKHLYSDGQPDHGAAPEGYQNTTQCVGVDMTIDTNTTLPGQFDQHYASAGTLRALHLGAVTKIGFSVEPEALTAIGLFAE
jgi:hypothetical protein